MASLAQAIHGFQNGRLSPREFLANVDQVLATDGANSARLRDILSEEHTKVMMPPDVYAELQRRVQHLAASKATIGNEDTRLQTDLGEGVAPTAPSMPSLDAAGASRQAMPGRMKGVGDTLNGRFVLEECIGFGGMGTVYKALDLRKLEASDRNPYIAIKVLNVQFSGHPQSLIALQREAKKAQTLAHPNIVTVYDFDRDGPMVYLTMEFLAGEPLSRTLRSPDFTGMPFDKALKIVGGVTRALAYAHERGFVHCDLKPANIIVTHRGEVKVIDFGIARVFRQPEEDSEATIFDAGSLGGLTPAYASPEMIEHLIPDPRDDIYALACITYELLTGKHPFNRLSATQARSEGLKPERPEQLRYGQWRGLRNALAFERYARTPTVTQFLEELTRKRHPVMYVALGGGGLAIGILIAAGLGYYRSLQAERSTEPPAATRAAPVSPEADRSASASAPEAPAKPERAPTPRASEPTAKAETPSAPTPPPTPAPSPPISVAALNQILSSVPCSALSASIDGHTLHVQGYLAESVGAGGLKGMMQKLPGMETLNLGVQPVSQDKCAAIQLLAPYWLKNHQSKAAASIKTRQANAILTEGEPLVVDIKTQPTESWVNVDYFALDGGVAHLIPNPKATANQAPANYAATVGDGGNWVISRPFGKELVVLLTTPAPLFDKVRPAVEPSAEYLRAVEKQLSALSAKFGADRVAVDFVQITTKARN
ncbi:MAG: protein kinase [Herminiimonas sp.]|nr:protein kinase [Herminiimonas sp.]MDB5854016.1 protein kinase [Herminiimonas sp.]